MKVKPKIIVWESVDNRILFQALSQKSTVNRERVKKRQMPQDWPKVPLETDDISVQ